MTKDIFRDRDRDLTISTTYTIKKSIVDKVKIDAKKNNLSSSKVISLILENYYKNKL